MVTAISFVPEKETSRIYIFTLFENFRLCQNPDFMIPVFSKTLSLIKTAWNLDFARQASGFDENLKSFIV